MSSGLELYESRISQLEVLEGMASVYFSHAYIHKSSGRPGRAAGSAWSQAARLVMSGVEGSDAIQLSLPATITEGYLEVGGIRHEIIPLPFKRKVAARLYLLSSVGTELTLVGSRPFIELLGSPIYLEDF